MAQQCGHGCHVPPAGDARRRVLVRLGVLLLAVAPAAAQRWLPGAQAQPASAAEYQVKAAFLVKFGSYVEWPSVAFDNRDSPFIIAVVAQDGVADEVERAAASAVVDGHPVQVRRVERVDAAGSGAHLLFIDRSRNAQLADTLGLVRGRPLLTVTESEQAFALGGMINFVLVENKVRFDIALAPAEASQLKISARLLAVARRVLRG